MTEAIVLDHKRVQFTRLIAQGYTVETVRRVMPDLGETVTYQLLSNMRFLAHAAWIEPIKYVAQRVCRDEGIDWT